MTSFVSRRFEGAQDLIALIDFTQRLSPAQPSGAAYWHAGDIAWQLFRYAGARPLGDVRLWFEGENLVAFAIFERPLRFQYELDPAFAGHGLHAEIVAWAVSRRARLSASGLASIPLAYQALGQGTLSTLVLETDRERQERLTAEGFAPTEPGDIFYARTLGGSVEPPRLPPGMRLRHAIAADTVERADLHADAWSVWGPSSMDAETHALLRAAPLYREELDVVVETGDGRLVSYAVSWFDPVKATGNLEPVGTRPAFTGLGLGKAVVIESLRRLGAAGASTAFVSTAAVNATAQHVYPACGFDEIDRGRFWTRAVQAADS